MRQIGKDARQAEAKCVLEKDARQAEAKCGLEEGARQAEAKCDFVRKVRGRQKPSATLLLS